MAYLENFEHDVFISYAHDDNQRHWVKDLRDLLQEQLVLELGNRPKPSVWYDEEQVSGHDRFDQSIPFACLRSAAMLCVVSPSYLQSDWCTRERKAFHDRPERGVKHRFPLLKASIVEVPRENLPREFNGLSGYQFFDREPPVRGWTNQYFLTDQNHSDKRFFNLTVKIAKELADTLKQIKASSGEILSRRERPASSSGTAVYLAEVTDALIEQRKDLASELGQFQIPTVPVEPLPTDYAALRARVIEQLGSCRVSVHLLGRHDRQELPTDPAPKKRSALQIQYDLAVEQKIPRIVWLAGDLDERDLPAKQREFLNRIQHGEGSAANLEFFRGEFSELKDYVRKSIRPPTAKPSATPMVFINAHQDDLNRREIRELRDCCQKYGCTVFWSAPHPDPRVVEKRDNSHLRQANGVVVLYANQDAGWVSEQALKVLNAIKQRPKTPPVAAVLDSEPPPSDKPPLAFLSDQVMVLDARGGFDPAVLDPFLRQLRGARPQ